MSSPQSSSRLASASAQSTVVLPREDTDSVRLALIQGRMGDRVKSILRSLARPVTDINMENGLTPLHIAANIGHISLVGELIEQYDAFVNATDYNGWTALHYACYNADLQLVKLLAETYNANITATTKDGSNVFDCARQCDTATGAVNVLSYLRSRWPCSDPTRRTRSSLISSIPSQVRTSPIAGVGMHPSQRGLHIRRTTLSSNPCGSIPVLHLRSPSKAILSPKGSVDTNTETGGDPSPGIFSAIDGFSGGSGSSDDQIMSSLSSDNDSSFPLASSKFKNNLIREQKQNKSTEIVSNVNNLSTLIEGICMRRGRCLSI